MAEKLGTAPAASGKLGVGDAVMLLTAFLFGSSFPFAKSVLPVMDPAFFSASRYGLAGLVLFGWLALRRQKLSARNADLRLLIFCAACFALFQTVWAFALSLTNASVGAIFVATSPLWGTILATIGGQRMRPSGWLGIVLAFCGVALVINNSLAAVTVDFGSLASSLLWLFTAFVWAFFVAISPPLVAQLGATRMFAWVMVIAAMFMAPLAVWGGLHNTPWEQMRPVLWLNYLYTAIFTAALALALWNVGLARLGVTRTMIYMYMVPLFAIAIAVLFLGEHMTPARWIGAAAVLAGIAITRRAAS
jgi:drug/metabolite transporter (DMT)-like permease